MLSMEKNANKNIKAVAFDFFGVIELFEGGGLNTELLSYLPRLKKLGVKTGIFSNANSILRERLKELDLLEVPDVLVISGEIGHQKPHKEAFQVLFEKLELQPEEVVFVDDTPRSLEKADEIGYIPILYKNNEQLKTDLKEGSRLAKPYKSP